MTKARRLKLNLIRWRARLAVVVALSVIITSGGCFESEEGEPYYGQVRVPRGQEFRWSDGGLPQTFDPALAAAPPDTDVVRALFEGLTDYDPQTLAPVAGVAARWEATADNRVWTFHLRPDARWSNGAQVTAQDFVRSWRRTLRFGDRAPHANLLANIVGATPEPSAPPAPSPTATPALAAPTPNDDNAAQVQRAETANATPDEQPSTTETAQGKAPAPVEVEPALGVEAVDDFTLRVRLQRADKNFPALVAHPVFRPVPKADNDTAQAGAAAPVVSNGAFQLTQMNGDKVVLERARNYWNVATVALERVQFVNVRDTESALAAYRAGELDAVTNTSVEPLAVKLLAPYDDFRRATFGALTYYEYNTTRPPFDDPRVRRALALAVDRARLSTDTLEGATEPAEKFLPPTAANTSAAEQKKNRPEQKQDKTDGTAVGYDVARAQQLLTEAGYPGGAGFPRIRLLVNRNEQHRAVAQAVAVMWRNALGVETDIMLKNWDEYEEALRAGDYDVARRSIVMQTTDEESNVLAMFTRTEQTSSPFIAESAPQVTTTPASAPAPANRCEPRG